MSIIPVKAGEKVPSPIFKWGEAMETPPSVDQIDGWVHDDPGLNWGLVCGRGEACGDCDDPDASQWVLADPRRPIFQGACVVRSGSGRAHLWFRHEGKLSSTIWRMVPGRKMGELRGWGNYALVPPSRLSTGGAYERLAGSFLDLPVIADPAAFLQSIVDAYLLERPDNTPPPDRSSKRILDPSTSQVASTRSRVVQDRFKKSIQDTLFTRGHQTPGLLNWQNATSNSEIDFAVCCEFYRKGWAFGDVEVLFASTLVGEECYRNKDRPNHGQGYLWGTWENARVAVDKDRAAQNEPKGTNFRVTSAVILDTVEEKLYTLVLETPDLAHHVVRVTSKQLYSMKAFQEAARAQTRFDPQFNANQQGNNFALFAQAADRIVSDVRTINAESTEVGRLVAEVRHYVSRLPNWTEPRGYVFARGLGWRIGDEVWLRPLEIVRRLQQMRVQGASGPGLNHALDQIWGGHERIWWTWAPDETHSEPISEEVIHLRLSS